MRIDDLVLFVSAVGSVRSEANVTIRAETGGTVLDVRAKPGQSVTRGQLLVVLDSAPLALSVMEARAAVDQATVQFIDATVPDSIVTGKGPDSTRRYYAIARSGLPGARARLENALLALKRSVIRAPFDGVVDHIDVANGEQVAIGQNVLTIVDVDHVVVEAQVLEHDLGLIRKGASAFIRPAALPGVGFRGEVSTILPLVDSVRRAGRVVVSTEPSASRSLRPGSFVDVTLEAQRLRSRLLVPASALVERDGKALVFVVHDKRAKWVYVSVGETNGQDTEILPDSLTLKAPLGIGDTVLVEGQLTLSHDAPVSVVLVSPGASNTDSRPSGAQSVKP